VIKKVRIPTPNLKGKILGKGGETIKALRRHYRCNLFVHGAGSLADSTEESERLNSGDPRHQHYTEPLHLRIECTGTAPEVYANIGGVTQILAELFSGKMYAVNLDGMEAMTSNSNGFSGHGASNQQQTSERYFSNTSGYTPIPMDQQQSTFSIPAHQEQFGSSGRGGYVYRGGVQKRDRGDSSGYLSHRGGGGGRTSDMQDSNGDTPTIGRGGGGGFSTSFRGGGGGGGGGNEFSTSSLRGGGNNGNELSTSSSFRGRGGGGSGTEFSTSTSFRGRGGGGGNSGNELSTSTSFRGRGGGH